LKGLKVFFKTSRAASTGNCVTCHMPPLFTDLSFHNMGISQSEYDQVNGEGSFAELVIPAAAEARRPSAQFRETPSKRKPGCADLGYWNFADLKTSPLLRSGETDDRFLQRMIATFKTPTLRNLDFTQPYMHTGGFSTVESALAELMRLSELARAGKVREGDEELARIRITAADASSLIAFLKTLNEGLKPGAKY
jgi:cytochrome c peroxidase